MKRRQFTPEFKRRVAREAIEVKNNSLVGRRYDLDQSVVGRWVKQYRSKGNGAFEPTTNVKRNGSNSDRLKELERENERLKNLLGEKDLENAILRDLVKKGAQI